jgi:translation elongation factor EF-Tu-like GTPase
MKPGVVARIRMKPENEGGRHGHFTEGFCPHFVVVGHETWLGVRVSQCPGPVAPGNEADVVFSLMYHPRVDYSILKVGTSFQMMEGPRVVATGVVIELRDAVAN